MDWKSNITRNYSQSSFLMEQAEDYNMKRPFMKLLNMAAHRFKFQ